MNTGVKVSTHYGALDAFFPAVLALSGDLERAAQLQQSSYKMWTTWGIEPEEFDYSTMKITYPGYELRPEIIESTYYLYYFTGKPLYLDMGKTYADSLEKYCRTDVAIRRSGQRREQAAARRYGELFPGGNSEVPLSVICSEVDFGSAQGGV